MNKSSGAPYFCGTKIAKIARVSSMSGSVNAIIVTYPRAIGAIIKAGGVNTKNIVLECFQDGPKNRSGLEACMHALNENVGTLTGELYIDGNTYKNCAINGIEYGDKIVNEYMTYSIDFNIGAQNTTDDFTEITQFEVDNLREGVGRKAQFVNKYGTNKRPFKIWNNIDAVINLENNNRIQVQDVESKDLKVIFGGGVERIKLICWAYSSRGEDGWKQTITSYIFNMMAGPLGNIGTLTIVSNVFDYALWAGVNLIETWPTSARYELEFVVSLQC
jgi:hypothetical protein